MSMKNLLKTWQFPDRTTERQQLTLRLNYDLYAKLHALKAVYDKRPVNDMINDILKAGLDEIIEALPSRTITAEEAARMNFNDNIPDEHGYQAGDTVGIRAQFDYYYEKILSEKSEDGSREAA